MQIPHINRHVTVCVQATWHETIQRKLTEISASKKIYLWPPNTSIRWKFLPGSLTSSCTTTNTKYLWFISKSTKSASISSMLRVRWMKFRGLFSFLLIPDPSPSNDWNRFCRGRCRVDRSFLHVQNGGDMSCVFCRKNHIWSPIERMSDRWTTPSPPGCFIWQFCRKVVAKSWCCGMKMLYFLNLIL